MPMAAGTSSASGTENLRGMDPDVVAQGRALFKDNCAACHGSNAQGVVENWQEPDENGRYPAPPLNGSAHTWHHTAPSLVNTVRNGTVGIGGSMPAWKDTLNDDQIVSIILWLTTLWPDPVFEAWIDLNNK